MGSLKALLADEDELVRERAAKVLGNVARASVQLHGCTTPPFSITSPPLSSPLLSSFHTRALLGAASIPAGGHHHSSLKTCKGNIVVMCAIHLIHSTTQFSDATLAVRINAHSAVEMCARTTEGAIAIESHVVELNAAFLGRG